MDIQVMPISGLERAHYNPRKALRPGDPEWAHIEKSLDEFGMVEPVVWNRQTGRLVGGHQRLAILEHKGHTETHVSVVDLDEAREKVLNLALNNAKGAWEDDSLAALVRELGDMPEFPATGFSGEDVNRILRQFDIRHSTDFLSDVLQAPASGSEASAAEDRSGAKHFNLNFAVTQEQRDIITRGLNKLKVEQALQTTVDALVVLCQQEME